MLPTGYVLPTGLATTSDQYYFAASNIAPDSSRESLLAQIKKVISHKDSNLSQLRTLLQAPAARQIRHDLVMERGVVDFNVLSHAVENGRRNMVCSNEVTVITSVNVTMPGSYSSD